jgi:hypothetical protein
MSELAKIKDITKKLRDMNKYIRLISQNGDEIASKLLGLEENSVTNIHEILSLEEELEQATKNLDFLVQIKRTLEQKQYQLAGLLNRKTPSKTRSYPNKKRSSSSKTKKRNTI